MNVAKPQEPYDWVDQQITVAVHMGSSTMTHSTYVLLY
jgi:hypothetical protein